jgi:hypothetical protein
MAYADTSDFYGDISINNTKVNFNSGVGYIKLTGGDSQSLSGAANFACKKVILEKASESITLNQVLSIDSIFVLSSGVIYTDSINIISLKSGSYVSGGSHSSYVSGPLKKLGNSAFIFPTGSNGEYRPVEISAPSSVNDEIYVEFVANFDSVPLECSSDDFNIFGCDYWKIIQVAGQSDLTLKFYWDSLFCGKNSYQGLFVSRLENSLWTDISCNTPQGSIQGGSVATINSTTQNGLFTFSSLICNNSGTVDIGSDPPVSYTYGPGGNVPSVINICIGEDITFSFDAGTLNCLINTSGFGYYAITNPNNVSSVTQVYPSGSSINYVFSTSGTYIVRTKINNTPLTPNQVLTGSANQTFTIIVSPAPSPSFIDPQSNPLGSVFNLCIGQTQTICANQVYSTYMWSTGATTQCINVNTQGVYQLSVSNQLGCNGISSFQVIEIPCCSLAIALSPQIPCEPATTSSINAQLNNGTGPYVINWQQTAGGSAGGSFTSTTSSFSLPGLLAGTYSVSVTDANNCTASSSATVFIAANPAIPQIVGTNSICNFANGLSYNISSPISGVVYSWSILPGFSAPGATATFNPSSGSSTTATFSTNTNYMVNVVATNTYGCTSSSQLPINACCTSSEATIVDGSSSTIDQSLMYFTIEGVFQVNTNTVWNGKDIKMGAGAQITIQPFKTLTIINTTITACDYFWKSINVSPYAQIIVDNSIIQGGQYAIDVSSRGAYTLQNNTRLYDNYISLRVSGTSSNLPRTITGTSIRKAPGTTSKYNSLLDYINQTPATGNTTTCNARPHTGIHLNLVGVNTIGSSLPGTSNYIADAVYGIRSINSWARVVHTVIENIQVDNCQTNNPEAGSGIYATTIYPTGNLWAWDNNAGAGYSVEIKNCKTGIRTDNLGPIVRYGVITQVEDGIRATNLPSSLTGDKFDLYDSEVEFRDRGVRIGGTAVRDIGAGVNKSDIYDYNTGTISNNVNGGVIVSIPKVAGSYLEVLENTFVNTYTPRGVFAASVSDLNITHNTFDLNSAAFQNGVMASFCDDIFIGQNVVEGFSGTLPWSRFGITLRGTGIVNAPANILWCNEVSNCSRDIWFDNVNGNFDFANNTMVGGRDGLFLTAAVLGNQINRFNKWCTGFVTSAINANAQSNILLQVPTTATPPAPPVNCEYNPWNIGNVTGPLVSILFGGSTSDPGCVNMPLMDTIGVSDYDRYIADSLPNMDIDYATKYHHYRMLAGKLAAHPEFINQDPSMEEFMETYNDSDLVVIANFEHQVHSILSQDQGFFDQAKDVSNILSSQITEIAVLDSILMVDSTVIDSILLARRFELTEGMDSLVNQIDSLMDIGYSYIAVAASELSEQILNHTFNTAQGIVEKDFLLFMLKYGEWNQQPLTLEDTTLISDMAHLCSYEYGPVVYGARNIYLEWFEEELDDAEICGTGARLVNTIADSPSPQVVLIPNPASKDVLIQVEGPLTEFTQPTLVELINLTGKQLNSFEFTGKSTILALETIPAGSYMVKVTMPENLVVYKKLLVIK